MPLSLSKQAYAPNSAERGYDISFFINVHRIGLWIGLLVGGYILWQIGGGFPPEAWGTLRQLLAEGVPEQPVAPVMIRSLLLLISWSVVLLLSLHALRPGSLLNSHREGIMPKALSPSLKETHRPPSLQAMARQGQPASTGKAIGLLENAEAATITLLKLDTFSSHEASPTIGSTFSHHEGHRLSDGQHSATSSIVMNGTLCCHRGSNATNECYEDTLLYASCIHSSGIENRPTRFGIFVLASAAGDGSSAGRTISRICAQTISHEILTLTARQAQMEHSDIEHILRKSMQRTNHLLHRYNLKHETAKTGMVTVLLTTGKTAYSTHVGANHGYLYRPQRGFVLLTPNAHRNTINQGNVDDKDSHERMGKGVMGLGLEPKVAVHVQHVSLQPDDVVVLCSTGLWQKISKTAFFRLVTQTAHYGYEVPTDTMNALLQAMRDHKTDGHADGGSACVMQVQAYN